MENFLREFETFAKTKRGVSPHTLNKWIKFQSTYGQYISPMIIEERQLNVATMDVFSRLMMERIIFLGVPIDDYVSNVVQAQLLFLENVDPKKDITLYINSPGGIIYAGFGIYDTMNYVSPDIISICTGLAASMAAVLLAAGTKGKRGALPHARIMIHQPMGSMSGQASDIEITAREIIKLKRELYEILALHTGQPFAKIEKDADRDFWMTPQQAQEYGIIDEIIVPKKKSYPLSKQ